MPTRRLPWILCATLLVSSALVVRANPASGPAEPKEPAQVGTRTTSWGELPVYFQPAQPSWNGAAVDAASGGTGVAVVDVLVKRNGRVLETAMVESSGHPQVDRTIERALKRAQLPRNLASPPERYVVRYTASLWTPQATTTQFGEGTTPAARPRFILHSWQDLERAPVKVTLDGERLVIQKPSE